MEVFRPALLMARATPAYRERYGVVANASNLAVIATNSKFEPVIGKPGDGASPSCAIVDEYHEHQTPELYDTMKTGMMARSQPLLLTITTAGTNIGGPCYQHQQELQKILEDTLANDNRFGIIFGIDDGDDWATEAALIKANPNYGVSIDRDVILADLREAIADPRKQAVFKTKHLNVWVGAASPWLNLHNLQQAGDKALTLEAFRGESCAVGLDLASKQDIASVVFEFMRQIDGQTHYYVITHNYCPQDAIGKPENAHYQGWQTSGHLIATPGNMIDLELIQEDIIAAAAIVVINSIAKDPWNSAQIGSNLANEGFEVIDVPQQVRYLSEPMKDIRALVDAGRFHHDANPCSVWQYSNVECVEDRNENLFPRKARAANKIDAAVGTIIAHGRAMVGAQPTAAAGMEVW